MIAFELKETTVELLEFLKKSDGPGVPTLQKKLQERVFREIMEQVKTEDEMESER